MYRFSFPSLEYVELLQRSARDQIEEAGRRSFLKLNF